GLHEVDDGHIDYDDENFSEMSFNERKKVRIQIGMVFQAGALFDSLSIEDNIMFPLKMFTNMTLDERRERANVCLNRVNLENVNNLLPSEISGGMQKRVAIARAIVNNPNYLFCDEPNSGLDPQTAIVIDNLIHEITEEYQMTTIINTHDMNSVLEIGQNIIYLYQGKKWWEGNKDDILHTDNKELNDFVFASKMLKSLRK
ncbi:MAG: ATP-binding cassette domain-containing protein, partial [Bacteroidia bacterium]|nr:ATP-binding cassette domain-containing protein [Bacteroidia bacterium]